jgi:hypothetical protein
MQGGKHKKTHSYDYKIDYTLHEPRFTKRTKKSHRSTTASLKFRTRSPSPVKNSSFMKPSLPIIKETAHLPHSRVQLDKLFRMLNERPSSRYDTRDTEMDIVIQEVDSVIQRCCTAAGRHRKPKRPIALPSLPLQKFLGPLANSGSKINTYLDSRLQYIIKTPPTRQKSSKSLHRSEPKHARSSSSLTGSNTKMRNKKARKANSISFMRDSRHIMELVKISNIKDIPTHMQSTYLSNASLYKSIILVTST